MQVASAAQHDAVPGKVLTSHSGESLIADLHAVAHLPAGKSDHPLAFAQAAGDLYLIPIALTDDDRSFACASLLDNEHTPRIGDAEDAAAGKF